MIEPPLSPPDGICLEDIPQDFIDENLLYFSVQLEEELRASLLHAATKLAYIVERHGAQYDKDEDEIKEFLASVKSYNSLFEEFMVEEYEKDCAYIRSEAKANARGVY